MKCEMSRLADLDFKLQHDNTRKKIVLDKYLYYDLNYLEKFIYINSVS